MNHILKKLLAALLTLLATTFVVFLVMELLPYDAISQRVYAFGPNRQAILDALRADLGLDLPLYQRYLNWLGDLLTGNLGISIHSKRPVTEIVVVPIARTLLLNGTSFILAVLLSVPIAVFCATRRSKWADYFSMILTSTAASIPAYIIGILLIYNFSRHISWLPISGMRTTLYIVRGYENALQEWLDVLRHMIQPVFAMTIVMLGTFVPYIRGALLEVLGQDYMRTAKAKGLTGTSILFKHAFKNATLPLISLVAMLLPGLIMSNIFIEAVFRWPGVGMLLIDSVYDAEVFIVSAIVLFYTLLTLVGSTLADIVSHRVDPRLKEEHKL